MVTEPTGDPDWAFGPERVIKCPECGVILSGLNWVLTDEDVLTGMALIPCSHELSTESWELSFSGRYRGGDRRSGHVIRTPKFLRKDGSS